MNNLKEEKLICDNCGADLMSSTQQKCFICGENIILINMRKYENSINN